MADETRVNVFHWLHRFADATKRFENHRIGPLAFFRYRSLIYICTRNTLNYPDVWTNPPSGIIAFSRGFTGFDRILQFARVYIYIYKDTFDSRALCKFRNSNFKLSAISKSVVISTNLYHRLHSVIVYNGVSALTGDTKQIARVFN